MGMTGRGDHRMRRKVRGEFYTQVDNRDPFAYPAWRSPVHRTPEPVIWLVQLVRLTWRTARFLCRHPLLDLAVAIVGFTWATAGWPGVVTLACMTTGALVALRVWRPDWFNRFVSVPLRSRWR